MALNILNLDAFEQRFHSLFHEAPFSAALLSGDNFKIEMANSVSLRLWGKDSTIIGKPLLEAMPEIYDQEVYKLLKEVYRTGKTYDGKEHTAYLEKNGVLEKIYVNLVYKAIKDPAGNITGVFAVGYDVTDQVVSKHKLIESEENIRNIFEQAPVGIVIFKGELLVVEMVNDTLLDYWGRKREEVMNKPIFDVLPEVAEQGIRTLATRVYNTGLPYTSPETPISVFRKGRYEVIIVRFGFRAMRDWQGKIVGILAVANDLTDLVTARQRMEKNEIRLKFLADAMPQVVWMAGADGTVTYYNKRVLEFAGVRELEDGSWVWEGILHPDDLKPTQDAWSKSVTTQTPYQVEHRVLMRDGTYRWHLSRAHVHDTDEGIKWYGTATDVHDQKILEMNLEEIVRERTLELQRSNDDLQQFAHVASHDLKEPVRKIKTFAHKLQDEYKNVLGERGNKFVHKIINATDRMFSMINGVLNYASMPASSARHEPIDLAAVIKAVQTDLEILIDEKEATISYGTLPQIRGIPDHIYQLFYNLINNSLKFAKANVPVVITITCNEEIVSQGNPMYEIVVADNGIGFEQEYTEQIFSTFFRLNSKDQYEGSGIGLALCKKIVERHGGTIHARGEKDKGAQFHILLPKWIS
jgi:PAS domain S-box-containing protein